MSSLPRSAWNGTLRLGELVIPVGLSPTREKGGHEFRTIHAGCGLVVQQVGVVGPSCPEHGPLGEGELAKGWEIAPGEYLPINLEQLAAIAPTDSRVIDLYAIVDSPAVEQLLVEHAYYLVPGKTRVGRQGYAALEHALRHESVCALARFTGWEKERVAAVRPAGGRGYVLALQELAPSADLRDPGAIADAVAAVELPDAIAELAIKLVNRLEIPFEPALLASHHRARVDALLEATLAGSNVLSATPTAAPARPSGDISAALEASLRAAPRSRRARREHALTPA